MLERGLARWNPEAGTCERYVFAPNDPSSLTNNTINGLLIDSNHHCGHTHGESGSMSWI